MSNIYPNSNKSNKIMSDLSLIETNASDTKKEMLNWKDSSAIQRLLDVISSILAEEYIATAKQNPEVFLKQGTKI